MNITVKSYDASLHEKLVDIWERAVRATHDFLTDEDIVFYRNVVRDEALTGTMVKIATNEDGQPLGFIGLDESHIEMLFVDPIFHGKGIGRALIQDAVERIGSKISVDVNEQNEQAALFYKRLGFEQIDRSELDSSGRPFPILHLKMRNE